MSGDYLLPEALRGTALAPILQVKLREVAMMKEKLPLEALQMGLERTPDARSFSGALLRNSPAVIAELKRASPSAGVLRPSFDPISIGREYEKSGAAALSVLTEVHHFLGGLENLASLRWSTRLPLLRKDFIVDSYQVFESRCAGADAVLLIVALLDRNRLSRLLTETGGLGMEALVEVHDETELGVALDSGATIVGVNNRDLRTLEVSLDVSVRLARHFPKGVVPVAESGIRTPGDIRRLMNEGFRAFLVGESFMRRESPGAALAELLSGFRGGRQKAS